MPILRAMPSQLVIKAPLAPELTAMIAAKVASGRYRSASEAVRTALRLLDDHERRNESQRRTPAARLTDAAVFREWVVNVGRR